MDSVDDHYSSKGPGLSGRLLISVPSLDDGPFEKSVVLIARHDTEHAFGVIINKPIAGLMAADAVKEVRLSPSLTAESAPVFFGGPCDPQKGIVLHSTEYQSEETIPAGNGMALTATRDALERLYGDQLRPQTSRLIAGHSGWSAGQLESEILSRNGRLNSDAWLTTTLNANTVFGMKYQNRWKKTVNRIAQEQFQRTFNHAVQTQ